MATVVARPGDGRTEFGFAGGVLPGDELRVGGESVARSRRRAAAESATIIRAVATVIGVLITLFVTY